MHKLAESIQQICRFYRNHRQFRRIWVKHIWEVKLPSSLPLPSSSTDMRNNKFYLKFHSSSLNHERIYLIRSDRIKFGALARWWIDKLETYAHDSHRIYLFGVWKLIRTNVTYLHSTTTVINTHEIITFARYLNAKCTCMPRPWHRMEWYGMHRAVRILKFCLRCDLFTIFCEMCFLLILLPFSSYSRNVLSIYLPLSLSVSVSRTLSLSLLARTTMFH